MVGFRKLLFHDIEFLNSESSSKILGKINRASNALADIFTRSAQAFFRNMIKALVSLFIVFFISWKIAIGTLLTVIFYTIIYMIRYNKDKPLAEEADKLWDNDFSRIWEVIPQAKLTKIFTNEDLEEENLKIFRNKDVAIEIKRQKLWIYANIWEFFFVALPTRLLKFFGAYLALQGEFGIATFVLLYNMIDSTHTPFWTINWFIWEFQLTLQRAKEYIKILRTEEKVLDPNNPKILKNANESIEFKNVSFKFSDSEKKVLDGLNMKFEGGKITALIGKSGGGKTTITNLICRFYDPENGEILLGKENIKNFSQKNLRENIGLVLQDSYVFSGTIAENLRYAKRDASDEEIIEALKKANAWDFVEKFEKKIDTEIGERGVKLSGGQRQRISIARAILKDSKILILDEATNALDSESEKLVQEALQKFMKDRTVIIIAHRLSTIHNADKIYVLDEGKILEEGNHKTLMEKNGTYKMLYDIQSGGFIEQKKILEEYEMG
ncbi:MAG: ABC transporter ATP-binding protein [Patescibacteria group bacterium]